MSASPSVNTTSSIFWRRTSVIIETYRAIYDVQYYEGFVAGQGNQDIGQTFDHLSSVAVMLG